jgi:hypothetical protein
MTYKDWSKRPDLIEELDQLLKHPALVFALSVLVEEQLPKEIAVTRADTPNLMNFHALMNAKREGYYDFYRGLLRLSQPRKESVVDTSAMEPWKYASQKIDE